MFIKIYSRDLNLLDVAIKTLYRSKVLVDYGPVVHTQPGFYQQIRVKCDESSLKGLLKKNFKKEVIVVK